MKTLVSSILRSAFYIVLLAPSFVPPAEASLPSKRVLVLYAEGKDLPANELLDKGIHTAVKSSQTFAIDLFTEYLNLSRFKGPGYMEALARFLGDKYAGIKPDLIITFSDSALDFMLEYGDRAFGGIPVIACTVFEGQVRVLERAGIGRKITRVMFKAPIDEIITVARTLKSGTRRIALVGGASHSDGVYLTRFRDALRQYDPALEVMEVAGLAMPDLLQRVSSLPPDSIVLYSTVLVDGAGTPFFPREALAMVSRAANVPVFGPFDSYLGYGIVGGRLLSFEAAGKKAMELVLRILGEEVPADIPFTSEDALVSMYDWRELQRWHIPETAVPPGAEIRYRLPSFWEEHWAAVLGVTGLITIETGLIVGLLVNVRRRRKAERSLRDSEDRVRLAVSSAGAGLWSAEVDTGGIWATERARQLFGFASEESLSDEGVLSRVHPADRDRVRRAFQQAVDSAKESVLEFRIVLPDGTARWVTTRGGVQNIVPGQPKHLMGACVDITARKLAEETLRQRESDLMRLTGRLISAQEEELRRLSRDLHDDLTQRLAVLAIDAGRLENALGPMQPEVSQRLAGLKTGLIDVSNEVHDLSRQLHPSILDDLGFVRAAESECAAVSMREGIDVGFTHENVPANISGDMALSLYRIIQEGLRNIAKHACATHVSVSLKGGHEGLVLTIQDNGIGFDPDEPKGKAGLGLGSMTERARLIQGELSITSEPGHGTRIEVHVPM